MTITRNYNILLFLLLLAAGIVIVYTTQPLKTLPVPYHKYFVPAPYVEDVNQIPKDERCTCCGGNGVEPDYVEVNQTRRLMIIPCKCCEGFGVKYEFRNRWKNIKKIIK